MQCPECKGESEVKNSRPFFDFIKRRRRCIACGHSWNTFEMHQDLCKVAVNKKYRENKKCCKCEKLVYDWKFCAEHLKEYKREDMKARREFFKRHGVKKPRVKKGPKR